MARVGFLAAGFVIFLAAGLDRRTFPEKTCFVMKKYIFSQKNEVCFRGMLLGRLWAGDGGCLAGGVEGGEGG